MEILTKGEHFEKALSVDVDSLTAYFRGPAAEATNIGTVDVAGVLENGVWKVEVGTENFQPGDWVYEIWGVVDGRNNLALSGKLRVMPSVVCQGAGVDRRSHAAKMVEAIESYLEGSAGEWVRKYKINNRELERHSIGELWTMLRHYKSAAAREAAKEAGRPLMKTIHYRF